MKTLGALPLLSAVGTAQTVTFSSMDYFGNTIASSTGSYTPGEQFNVTLDLSINTWSLKELKLNTGTYGVDECTFQFKTGHSGWTTVGTFQDICEWPNFVDTELYLNVENIPQFRYGYEVGVTCNTNDVSWKTVKKNLPCEGNKALTPQNNQLANPYSNFEFWAAFNTAQDWTWDTSLIYLFNLGDIFLSGLNPVLDLVLVGGNNAVYQANYERLLLTYGAWNEGSMTQVTETALTPDQIHTMLKEMENFGFWTYGIESAAKAYLIFEQFNDQEWAAFNDYIFNFESYSATNFAKVINGELAYKDEWWTDLSWYFRLEVLAMETITAVYMFMEEPFAYVQWWPRNIRALWNFVLAFYE